MNVHTLSKILILRKKLDEFRPAIAVTVTVKFLSSF